MMTGADKTPQFKELQKFYDGFKKQLAQVVQINANAQVAEGVMTQAIRSGIRPGGPAQAQLSAPTETTEAPLATASAIPNMNEGTTQ